MLMGKTVLVLVVRTRFRRARGRTRTALRCSGRNVNRCTTTLTRATQQIDATCFPSAVVFCGHRCTTATTFTSARVSTTTTRVILAGRLFVDVSTWRRSCWWLPSVPPRRCHSSITMTTTADLNVAQHAHDFCDSWSSCSLNIFKIVPLIPLNHVSSNAKRFYDRLPVCIMYLYHYLAILQLSLINPHCHWRFTIWPLLSCTCTVFYSAEIYVQLKFSKV